MYEYLATYLSNYDGDTIKLKIDLGFGIYHDITVRLLGVDCGEIKSKNIEEAQLAIKAKEFTHNFFLNTKQIYVRTHKDKKEKYGRYLAEIITLDGDILNEELLKNNLAKKM